MSKQKTTPWFPPSIKPVKSGPYQTTPDGSIWDGCTYKYWNGRFWGLASMTAANAYKNKGRSATQNNKWRGLTAPAKEAA